MQNITVIKLWRVAVAKRGQLPIFAFFWDSGTVKGQGRFVTNSERTFIRLSTDKHIKLEKHTRWSLQIQLLALLRQVHPKEFDNWLWKYYPEIAKDAIDEIFA